MEAVNHYSETDLGNVSPNPRGEYDPKEAYEYLDLVSYQGGSYLCLTELGTTIIGTAPEPGHNTEFWQMLTLPGGLTSEYVAMHDNVVNKAAQVEISRAAVEQAQQEVEASQADVQQLHTDTVQAAQKAENSRDSAAGYAQSAETSRKAVSESEQNINAQMTGLNQKVSELVTEAQKDISAARQQAIDTITTQEDTSTEAVEQVGNAALESARQALRDINTAGQQAVQAVTDQKNASVQAVKDEAEDYIENKKKEIDNKTDEVTQAVNQAGKKQLEDIANSLDSTLTKEGKVADAKAVGDAITQLSIIESASGSEITLDDSAEMPLKELHVYGKSTQTITTGAQLLDVEIAYADSDVAEINGNKIIFASIQASSPDLKRNYGNIEAGTYTVSAKPCLGATSARIEIYIDGIKKADSFDSKSPMRTFNTESGNLSIKTFSTKPENSVSTVYGGVADLIMCKGDTACAWEPYTGGVPSPSLDYPQEITSIGDSGSTMVAVRGKNLYDANLAQDNKYQNYNISTSDFLIIQNNNYWITGLIEVKPETEYFTTPVHNGGVFYRQDKTPIKDKIINPGSKILTPEECRYICVSYDKSKVVFGTQVQMEKGNAATAYEPYCNPQTINVQTPNGLPGIPVTSGGNYTDFDGQQWICDEIDFERGVYIQQVTKKIIDSKAIIRTTNSKSWLFFIDTKDSINTNVDGWIEMVQSNYFTKNLKAWNTEVTGILGNGTDVILSMPGYTVDTLKEWLAAKEAEGKPLEVYYLLSNPIEIPLTEEQIASYKALHTYNDTTIIESEADLSLSYVANPKKYIDKKFTELSQAIIASASEAE